MAFLLCVPRDAAWWPLIDSLLRTRLDARARTLEERWNVPASADAAAREDRDAEPPILDIWNRAFAGADVDSEVAALRLARRLTWDGRTPQDARAAAARELGDPGAPWIAFLEEAFSIARRDRPDSLPELAAFRSPPRDAAWWIPLVRAARARLAGVEPAGDVLLPAARLTLEGLLLADLAALGAQVLASRAEPPSASRLEEILVEFPVLARLASTLATDWVAAAREFLERLENDRTALASRFGARGGVSAIRADVSDRHNGGRRVSILTFESGTRVVYKPRAVALEADWNGFLSWMRAAGCQGAPPALGFLVRDGYGWSEFVTPAPLGSEADVETYFESAGGLLAAAWLLGARDFHMDNVVATACGPVVVDAEAILQPHPAVAPVRVARSARGAFDAASARLDASFLSTGLVALEETDANGRRRDVGGLAGASRENESPNLPVFSGTALKAEDRPGAVLRGFASAYRFLLARRGALEALRGPLVGIESRRTRVIFRPSDSYARLLAVVTAPRYLREGWMRSVALDALNRPFATRDDAPPLWPLIADERASLERMDVPWFDLGVGETEPVSASGLRATGHFARSGIDALKGRLARMSEEDLAAQVRLLAAYLSRGVSSRAPARDAAADGEPLAEDGEISPEEFLRGAEALGRKILADAVEGDDGSLAWMDPAAVRGEDRRDRGASYYLYDGGAGIFLFFAALAKVLGSAEFGEAARRAMLPLGRVLAAPDLSKLLATEPIGACSGLGSLVYACAVGAGLLGDAALLELGARAAALLTPERISADTLDDIEGGSAGAILGLLALHASTRNSGVLEAAVAAGEQLLRRGRAPGEGLKGWTTSDGLELSGLAHGSSGIALALRRVGDAAGRQDFLVAARDAWRHAAGLFDASTGNWPVPVRDGARVRRLDMVAWCHGAPGVALSFLEARDLDEPSPFDGPLEAALAKTHRTGLLSLDHVCCGNAGLVEALASAGESLSRPALAAAADARLGAMLRRARVSSRYQLRATPEENAGVLPGFFRGQSGIGYTLLRRARPGLLPNVLAFEPPGAPGLERP